MDRFVSYLYGLVAAVTLSLLVQDTTLAVTASAPTAVESAPNQPHGALHITIIRDVSPSMKTDGRHETAGEVLRLAANLLECQVTIVEFATEAKAGSFALPAERDTLLDSLNDAQLGDGTSYVAALKETPPTTTAVVFLSDGEPKEPRDEVIACLKRHLACPLHAVAIEAEAEETLREMAAITGGSFYRARDARALVEALWGILAECASLRTKRSTGDPLELGETRGRLLCIGINTEPKIHMKGPLAGFTSGHRTQDIFRLPGTDVHLVTDFLTAPQQVLVSPGTTRQSGPCELIVATFGGPELGLKLERTGDGKLLARAEFAGDKLNADNQPIASTFTIIGEDGQVEQVVAGKRVGDQLVAEMDAPPKGSYDIRLETVDAEDGKCVSSRTVFSGTESLPLVTQTAKPHSYPNAQPEPKPTALTDGSVDLLLVAHRTTGPVVLAQSGQAFQLPGLSGIDRVSLEVVRGSMDPRVFGALRSVLNVRWLRDDGGVERTQLKLEGDRLKTQPVCAEWQGRLVCELRFGPSDSASTLKLEAQFLPVSLRLRDVTTHPIPRTAPEGTVTRPEFALEAQVGKRPATPEELIEVLAAEEPVLTLAVQDRLGKPLQRTEHRVTESGRFVAELVLGRAGTYDVLATLKSRKSQKVWSEVKWPQILVEPSPLEVSLCRRSPDGSWVPVGDLDCPAWVPTIFRKFVEDVFYAVRLKPDRPTQFFVENVVVGDRQVQYDAQANCYLIPATGIGEETCLVTFGSVSNGLAAGGTGLPARVPLAPEVPSGISYGRLGLATAFAVFLPLAVILGRGFRRARRLKTLGNQVTLIADGSCETLPVVREDRLWPSAEVLVLRNGTTYRLAYPGESQNGSSLVGRVRQRGDGSVVFKATEDLPGLGAGKARALAPGDSEAQVDEATMISVNVGEAKTP